MHKAVEGGLGEFVHDRLSRRWFGSEEGRTECSHARHHRDRRVGRQVRPVGSHSPDVHAFRTDLTEDGQSSSDVSDASLHRFFLAQGLRGQERHAEASMLDEHVVQLPDEMPGQLVFVGLFRDDGPPRLGELIDEAYKRNDKGFTEQGCLRAEVAEE